MFINPYLGFALGCIFVTLAGLILYMFSNKRLDKKISGKIAKQSLNGVVQHESKALLKGLQNKVNESTRLLLLRNLTNVVITYRRLGGTYLKLNEMLETTRATLATRGKPIYPVIFGGAEDKGFNFWLFERENNLIGWISVSLNGAANRSLYHFEAFELNSVSLVETPEEASPGSEIES